MCVCVCMRAGLQHSVGEMTNHLGLGEIKPALGDNGIEKGHRYGHTLVFTRAGIHHARRLSPFSELLSPFTLPGS